MTESSATQSEMLDTNVLVYAYDNSQGVKCEIANELLARLVKEQRLVLSVQALNEFYSVVTKPNRKAPLTHRKAHAVVSHLASSCPVFSLSEVETFRALDAMQQNCLAFWDALIWAVAVENGVSVVYTEDFQHGRVIDGVRFCNPFEAAE